MDDIFIPLWPPAWVEDLTISDAARRGGGDVKLMSALGSDERVLLSVSWPAAAVPDDRSARGRRARGLSRRRDVDRPELARSIDAMWSQALQLAKQILDGELPSLEEPPSKRRRWRRRD